MKHRLVRLWLGICLAEIMLMLLVEVAGWLHVHLSGDPSAGDGYGFTMAFFWMVISAPWPMLAPIEWFENHFWALFVGGALLNSLLLAVAILLVRTLWRRACRS
ncbi:hypothetical protein [Sulfurivirga sp.]|uniref:hypothetical protein n=1 Tax=Sulfurivirga sp. TaxID=2614236 RepID=UPI0025E06253|nr:hypothetical protein [Sulfurivirga sp.]